jgi:phosphate acetyltransferase
MSHVIAALRGRATALKHRIVLPETSDPRIILAAVEAHKDHLADIILLGSKDALARKAKEVKADLSGLGYIDPHHARHSDLTASFAQHLFKRRGGKDLLSLEEAHEKILNHPLYFGNCLVAHDYVHGQVGGSLSPTADVVKSALHCIGTAPGCKTASSFMLMLKDEQEYVFSDCGFVIDPNAEQLADIAITAASNAKKLLLLDPRVAMLSFSTKGSAHHQIINKVIEAVKIVKERDSTLLIDGELQFDAAFVPSVGAYKAPGSPVAGKANVFIFPDLNAGNIGYKIAARLGGFEAVGPILQGFAKPTNDLSRGCAVEDIVDTIAITALQTGEDHVVKDIPNIEIL